MRNRFEEALSLGCRVAGLAIVCWALAWGAARAQADAAVSPDAGVGATHRVRAAIEPCLNFRPAPSYDNRPWDCLAGGTEARLLASEGSWSRVQLSDGRVGWVAKQFLEPLGEGPVPSTPVPSTPVASKPAATPVAAEPFPPAGTPSAPPSDFAGLTADLELCREERQDLARRVDELTRGRVELERRCAALEVDLEALTRRVEAGRDDTSRLRERDRQARGDLEDQLAASRRSAQVLQQELEAARRVEAELRARLKAASAPAVEPAEPIDRSAQLVRPRPPAPSGRVQVEAPLASEAASRDAPEPVVDSVPDQEQVIGAIRAWASAWSAQRAGDYLAFYSQAFRPAGGLARDAWEAQRRVRVTRPRWVELELSAIGLRPISRDRIDARFSQTYRSDRFGDTVVKTLEMIRENGTWKILAERVESGQ